MKSLDTPVKRVGALILAFGIVLSAIAAIQILGDTYAKRHFVGVWLESVFFEKYSFRKFPLASYATWITLIGLLFSFWYEATVKRLWAWVATGSLPPRAPGSSRRIRFKDASSALEHACKHAPGTLLPGQITPCLVICANSSGQSLGLAVIDIPTSDGPKRTTAAFTSNVLPSDIIGRLCAARVGPADPETGVPSHLICGEFSLTWRDGAWQMRHQL
ncbi:MULTISPECIES: hypothetical protein [unclassified Pseudomonas]|uniref:hypothetical protein n=1 Tax=unclassified Pseudomonas TaxID=196821 RepID=UPI00244913FC|nr:MULTISPECIES: hypothetical protein [unclassified Pseudomonas]MDH0303470.1 hypothetical protein [Pseudomonas sp. GD04091]MDH1984463.1 hypothetical protein [Pseudomonas sp. GD03689]